MQNEMRDRLIQLITNSEIDFLCSPNKTHFPTFLADHLIENGVIVPPCKVGQTIWFIRDEKIIETKVEKIVLKNKGVYLKLGCNAMYETSCNSIGKTVFLTREEAEQKLKGGADNGKVY